MAENRKPDGLRLSGGYYFLFPADYFRMSAFQRMDALLVLLSFKFRIVTHSSGRAKGASIDITPARLVHQYQAGTRCLAYDA